MQRFFKSIILIFLAFVFIFSAIAKMVPIEFFEFQIADILSTSWRNVQILSRIIICTEFALGCLLLLHFELRRFTLPFVTFLLVAFTGLLIYQLILHGNQENCGCFGDQVEMTTAQGIGKNVFLLLFVVLAYKLSPKWEIRLKYGRIVAILLFSLFAYIPVNSITLGILPSSMLKPIDWTSVTQRKPENKKVDYSRLYDTTKVDKIPSFDYKIGKHIIVFADARCNHCRLATQKMAIMKKQNPDLPFLVVIYGTDPDLKEFNKVTQSDNLEKIRYTDGFTFTILADSPGMPSINWINNGLRAYQTVHYELISEDIEVWLQTK